MLATAEIKTLKQAQDIAGTLGFPSKMPGTSYGLPAFRCILGAKLHLLAGTTCFDCYAMKGKYPTRDVAKGQNRRFDGLRHPQWVVAMAFMLLRAHGCMQDHRGRFIKRHRKIKGPLFHRWHDAGDLQGVWHLANICAVARLTPQIRHWLPTREFGFVRQYLAQGGDVPENLVIRISATKVDGQATAHWPTTSTVHQASAPVGHTCPAPTQGNACGDCRACWAFTVSNVSYHKH